MFNRRITHNMNNKLNLYVWDEVLKQYSYGMILVFAESVEEARNLLMMEAWNMTYDEVSKLSENKGQIWNDIQAEPRIIDKPEAFICWGSE